VLGLAVGCDVADPVAPAVDAAQAAVSIRTQVERCELAPANSAARQLTRSHADRPEGWLLLGDIAKRRWDTLGAAEAYTQAYALSDASFPELPLLVQFMRLSGSSDVDIDGLLDDYEQRYPDDPHLLDARLAHVAQSAQQRLVDGEDIQAERALATEILDGPALPLCSSAPACYHRAEALFLVERWEQAEAVLTRGIDLPGDPWDQLTMRMSLAFLLLQRGEVEPAKALMQSYLDSYMAWEGCHFATLMPMPEYLGLTWRAHFGEPLEIPAAIASKRETARAQGVGGQYDIGVTLRSCGSLLEALAAEDPDAAGRYIEDLRILLARDIGCLSEAFVIRPHMVRTLDLLEAP